MTNTLDLPIKYRPKTFDDVCGQDAMVSLLRKNLERNTLRSCLIFAGPPGTGKTTCARVVARILNPSPFGFIEKDSSESGKKDSILTTLSDIYNAPMEGVNKTYHYDEAHNISRAAFDSLLKITEEPPPNVKIIFSTSNIEKIPSTIVSRSQIYTFNRISASAVRNRINYIAKQESLSVNQDMIDLIVDYSNGSLRNALIALETAISINETNQGLENLEKILGIVGTRTYLGIIKAYFEKDLKTLLSIFRKFDDDSCNLNRVISDFQQYITDLRIALVMKSMSSELRSDVELGLEYFERLILSKKDKANETIRHYGSKLDLIYDLLLDLEVDLRKTGNKTAVMNRYCIRLAQSFKSS